MNINLSNIKDKSNENLFSPRYNLKVSSSSKGKPQDELDTNKNVVSHKLSKSLTEKQATVSSPSHQPVLESAPPAAKVFLLLNTLVITLFVQMFFFQLIRISTTSSKAITTR